MEPVPPGRSPVLARVRSKWQELSEFARHAQAAVPRFRKPSKVMHGVETRLPQDLWSVVFRHLATTLEPDGLRGPGVVAADIVRAGMTCRDMHHGSRAGLEALAEAVTIETDTWPHWENGNDQVDWALLDRALSSPMDVSVPELSGLLRCLNLDVPPTKPGMVLALLNYFKLSARCSVPARLWVALRQELNQTWGSSRHMPALNELLMDMLSLRCEPVGEAMCQDDSSMTKVRQRLLKLYGNTEALAALHRELMAQAIPKEIEAAKRQMQTADRQAREAQAQALYAQSQAARWQPQVEQLGMRAMGLLGQVAEMGDAALIDQAGGFLVRVARVHERVQSILVGAEAAHEGGESAQVHAGLAEEWVDEMPGVRQGATRAQVRKAWVQSVRAGQLAELGATAARVALTRARRALEAAMVAEGEVEVLQQEAQAFETQLQAARAQAEAAQQGQVDAP